MDQIAFFWVGKNIEIPSFLVKSINHAYDKKNVKIFHLTDLYTPQIYGVHETIRQKLPEEIMLARLTSFLTFPHDKNMTYFCDADSLFLNQLNLQNLEEDIYLIKRPEDEDWLINNKQYTDIYPEFKDKMFSEVMPYMFGGMAIRNGRNFFEDIIMIIIPAMIIGTDKIIPIVKKVYINPT